MSALRAAGKGGRSVQEWEMDEQKHILVVDDEAAVLFVLQQVLDRVSNGYDVMTVSDGRSALDEARKHHYDLVITDLRMPKVGGLELTRELRRISPDTRVLWITACWSPEVAQEADRLGVRNLLSKPLEVREIRKVVRDALA
jgi:two-component system response regulator PilR (NtrC family)